MSYFNKTGEAFLPVGYPGVDFATAQEREAAAVSQDGLFYRSREFPELVESLDACLVGERPFGGLPLDAYQAWNETGWKAPQATKAAVDRFGEKLREEQREVDDALEEYFSNRDKSEHLLEEVGDYLWVATALANNAGVVISDAIKSRLYAYATGTKEQDADGKFGHPAWYDTAASLAIKREPISVADLDQLITDGFVPRCSPIMNLYEEETICATAFVFDFQMYGAVMVSLSQRLYEDFGALYSQSPVDENKDGIAKLIAETYFRVAAIAHFASGSMEQVIEMNTRKIAQRILAGTVDKSDGPRLKGQA